MKTRLVKSALPSEFDVRVTRALEAPLQAGVAIAVDHVAMNKSPRGNYRFTLAADGALCYVQHSGKGGDWQVPFDQPLPGKPATRVPPDRVTALLASLESAQFFAHPGYEADPQTEDGDYWIVRARRGQALHAVVYQNVTPAFVAELTALSDPLWKQPK